MTSLARRLTAIALGAVIAAGLPPAPLAIAAVSETIVIGRSGQDRPIVARRVGPVDAPTVIVVLGQMHGDEPAGRRVVEQLERAHVPEGVQLWLVRSINPDGQALRRRSNARGVDLNRNFPSSWVRQSGSGRQAASEHETRAVMTWLTSIRPDALVSLHQPFGVVDVTHRRSRALGRELAARMGLPTERVGCPGRCHGTLTGWADETLSALAWTVELAPRPSTSDIQSVARGISWLATRLGSGSA